MSPTRFCSWVRPDASLIFTMRMSAVSGADSKVS
jgi:hypothetical protein